MSRRDAPWLKHSSGQSRHHRLKHLPQHAHRRHDTAAVFLLSPTAYRPHLCYVVMGFVNRNAGMKSVWAATVPALYDMLAQVHTVAAGVCAPFCAARPCGARGRRGAAFVDGGVAKRWQLELGQPVCVAEAKVLVVTGLVNACATSPMRAASVCQAGMCLKGVADRSACCI